MKLDFKNSQYNNTLFRDRNSALEQNKHNKHKINNDFINTHRPAQEISFGGSAVSKGINEVAKGAKKAFNKTVEFVYDNEVAYNAIYALLVAGILKPMCVLNMPGSEDKDKQIVATKNFLQAFIGSFLSYTIGGKIIKKSVDLVENDLDLIKGVTKNNQIELVDPKSTSALELAKKVLIDEKSKGKNKYVPTIDEIIKKSESLIEDFKNNRLKHFSKNPEFIAQLKDKEATVAPGKIKQHLIEATKKLPESFRIKQSETTIKDGYKTFWKNSTGFITSIGKAKISSLLLPTVMAFLFAKKNLEKEARLNASKDTLSNNASFKQEQQQFKKMMNKNNPQVAFKGGVIPKFASAIECMGNSKAGSRIAKWMASFNKPTARMADFESVAITAYWLQNTARSKKIEPSQKLGLNVHSALVTIVSSAAAFIIDWALDGRIDKSKEKYKDQLKTLADELKTQQKGESIDSILANFTDARKMAIKDAVQNALKQQDAGKEINIDAIVANLKSQKAFEEVQIDKTLIQRIIDSLKQVEIFDKCKDMIGAKDIARRLSEVDLNNEKEVAKALSDLTKKYGKKLSKFKSLTIFTLVVRFLVPVLMIPFSGKMKKKINEWNKERQANKY